MEAKQVKLAETCEMVQIHVARILKEAEEKWKTAQELRVNRAQLEKMLITAQSKHFRFLFEFDLKAVLNVQIYSSASFD